MKLHADRPDTTAITAHGDGWVAVNGQRHHQSIVVRPEGDPEAWSCARLEDLTAAHFESLLPADGPAPELVLLGSGRRLRFVPPALLAPLIARRVGVETMDTAAACRTYNILAGEGRRVVAALLIEG